MNTNDAKEYLARREIPQLFEVSKSYWAARRLSAVLGSGACGPDRGRHLLHGEQSWLPVKATARLIFKLAEEKNDRRHRVNRFHQMSFQLETLSSCY